MSLTFSAHLDWKANLKFLKLLLFIAKCLKKYYLPSLLHDFFLECNWKWKYKKSEMLRGITNMGSWVPWLSARAQPSHEWVQTGHFQQGEANNQCHPAYLHHHLFQLVLADLNSPQTLPIAEERRQLSLQQTRCPACAPVLILQLSSELLALRVIPGKISHATNLPEQSYHRHYRHCKAPGKRRSVFTRSKGGWNWALRGSVWVTCLWHAPGWGKSSRVSAKVTAPLSILVRSD